MEYSDSDSYSNNNNKQEIINKVLENKKTLCEIGKNIFKKILRINTNEQRFDSLLRECEAKKIPFQDNLFPPNENSLLKGSDGSMFNNRANSQPKNFNNRKHSKWHKIKWLKSNEIFESVRVFNQTLDPNCIRQGALNNCYFLSAVAALAERPDRIKSLFLSQEPNEAGIYSVRLCLCGTWREILIDDYFPCDANKNFPSFSFSKDGSLWLNILEKCYAKTKGSYFNLEKNGSYEQTIRELTGAPIQILDNSNENLLASIKEACGKRWIITASAGETEASRELLQEVGLIPLHTYIIMDIYDLSQLDDSSSTNFQSGNVNGNLNNLNSNNNNNLNVSNSQLIFSNSNYDNILKIKNPWGKNEWIGDWSDYSNLWRDDLKIKLNYNSQDNCFYMNFKDFKHYFSKIQICKIHDGFVYNSIQLTQRGNTYSLLKLTVPSVNSNANLNKNEGNNNDYFNSRNNLNLNNVNIGASNNINNFSNSNLNFNNNYANANQPVYISLIQNEIRKSLSKNTEGKKYSIARIILSKLTHKAEKEYEVEYITGKISQEKELFEEKELEAGEYILFVEVDKISDKNNNADKEGEFLESFFSGKTHENAECSSCFYSLTANKFNHNSNSNFNNQCENCYSKSNKKRLFNKHSKSEFNNGNYDSAFYELFSEEKFVISTYSQNQIDLKELKIEDYPNILQKMYISCAKKDNNVLRFTNDGAPNCLKYSNVTAEGYAYIYFENNEVDATLIEDVKYTKFEGLKLLPPFNGTSYYVRVGPGESQIVLIKQVDLSGFNLIYSYHSNFLFSKQRLLALTKSKGKKTFRKDPKLNIDVDIVVYTYKHSLGLCFHYENNTTDRKLEETLRIKATGVEIIDCDMKENHVSISLGPGETKTIELRARKNNWSVQSSVYYKIENL